MVSHGRQIYAMIKTSRKAAEKPQVALSNALHLIIVLIIREPPDEGFPLVPKAQYTLPAFLNAGSFRCLRTATKGSLPLETRSLFEKSSAKTFNTHTTSNPPVVSHGRQIFIQSAQLVRIHYLLFYKQDL